MAKLWNSYPGSLAAPSMVIRTTPPTNPRVAGMMTERIHKSKTIVKIPIQIHSMSVIRIWERKVDRIFPSLASQNLPEEPPWVVPLPITLALLSSPGFAPGVWGPPLGGPHSVSHFMLVFRGSCMACGLH